MGRWSTITVNTDVEIDIDDFISDIETEDLEAELKKRNKLPLDESELVNRRSNVESIEYAMKLKIIKENIHKFTWLECCEIFENKKG